MYFLSGSQRNFIQGGNTNIIGRTPPNRVQGGTASSSGGLRTGDGYPTQTPWLRIVPDSTGAPGTIPPTVYFENEIAQNTDAAVIIPDIWSTDGFTNMNLRTNYVQELVRSRPAVSRAVIGMLTRAPRLELGNYLRPGAAMGIGNTISVPFGLPQDRPIGLQPVGRNFGFTPQVLVLTYDFAEFVTQTSFGFGRGVVPVRYVDPPGFDGDYTLYLKVERMDTRPPCAASITGSMFTGTAVLTTTRREAAGPYNSDVNLTVDFVDCGTIRITNFPPLISNSETALGPNTSTMTMLSGGAGRFESATRRIEMPVTLGLQNSIRFFGNSTLPLTLTGTIDPASGVATLRGRGTFSGGQLGTFDGIIVVNGTFSQRP
jgi:hypothetical protein